MMLANRLDVPMTKKRPFTTEESRWKAVYNRDKSADGYFYFGVKTTRIFCRPGCASRTPNRAHVEYFDRPQEAERAGYRPCKRCTPTADSAEDQTNQIIFEACRQLIREGTPPTLRELAENAGMSQGHFHKLFRQKIGLTPKQFAASQQAERFRQSLENETSVTEAIFNAGFSSSSSAFAYAEKYLAMSPSAYQQGGKGLEVHYGTANCFLGWVIVAVTARGICAVEFGDDPEELPARLRQSFPQAQLREAETGFNAVIQEIVDAIEAGQTAIDFPLDLQGTIFQKQVWNALREIPLGATVSYSEIAKTIEKPQATRAVASACAANKIGVLVPCHRVLRQDGKLGGYRWGLERKATLLEREKNLKRVEMDLEA